MKNCINPGLAKSGFQEPGPGVLLKRTMQDQIVGICALLSTADKGS